MNKKRTVKTKAAFEDIALRVSFEIVKNKIWL